MKENFTKQDLRTGMIVTCRNEEKYIVCLQASVGNFANQEDLLISDYGYNNLAMYTNDLYVKEECCPERDFRNYDYDIIKVEQPNSPSLDLLSCDRTLLWERKEKKESEEPKTIILSQLEVLDILREKYGHDATIHVDCTYVTFTDTPSDKKIRI